VLAAGSKMADLKGIASLRPASQSFNLLFYIPMFGDKRYIPTPFLIYDSGLIPVFLNIGMVRDNDLKIAT